MAILLNLVRRNDRNGSGGLRRFLLELRGAIDLRNLDIHKGFQRQLGQIRRRRLSAHVRRWHAQGK